MTIDAPNDHHRELPRTVPVRRRVASRMAALGVALAAALVLGAVPMPASAASLVAAPDTSVDSAAGTMVFVFSLVAVLLIAAFLAWKAQKNRPR